MLRMYRLVGIVTLAFLGGAIAIGVEPQDAFAGGGCRGFTSTEQSGDEVRMEGTCFFPTVLHIEPGDTVTWSNESGEPHSVSGATVEWGNYEELREGDTVSFSFDKPGTYPYYCFVHNGMIGAIVVGDGRRVAESSTDDVTNVSAKVTVVSNADSPVSAPAELKASGHSNNDGNALLFSAMGILIGGTLVAVGFGLRELRPN